ncbi:vascular cell adhesion protein 1-like [Dendronephthya gigantea]|uniref:vascular cell adhesion protein 1-like n=1 Tax=Dendronephthya gigantea TaxID=151771 RepID=UPI00106D7100|nr:vascular cell adhesion protein 1-like [Dendronephthya gigantea]
MVTSLLFLHNDEHFSFSHDTGDSSSTTKPNVTVNCSSPLIVKEGDDVVCECKCEGGNPPAECTWYKNGTQISEIGKDVNTLIFRNFNGRDSGRYTCVGQSHVKARDEESIRITDIFKPVNTVIRFSQKSVEIGKSVTITCASEGFPEPRFTIFHNDTKVVSNDRTYTICKVKWDDAGTYKCFAKNELGNDAAFAIFAVEDILFLLGPAYAT